jgi:L-asparaginase II
MLQGAVPGVPGHVPLVLGLRGGLPELVYVGSVAVVDTRGRLMASVGDPYGLNFTRSALKPIQALSFVRDNGPANFGFGSHEVALMCASHNGEAIHAKVVAHMLKTIGADEADLQCGCHAPYWYGANDQRAPEHARWRVLQHNCSGKHAGFLAYCRLHGHRFADYLAIDSPVQTRVRNTVAEFTAGAPISLGIDGCGAPNLAVPLASLATMFTRLACDDEPALAALRYAMTRHSDLVSGGGRGDLALTQLGDGDWVCKVGADGVQAIGVRSLGIGIAIRVADGNARALQVATAAVLQQLGLVGDLAHTALADWVDPPIKSLRGVTVGQFRPAFELPRLF